MRRNVERASYPDFVRARALRDAVFAIAHSMLAISQDPIADGLAGIAALDNFDPLERAVSIAQYLAPRG
jgi:hypothetical protein